MSTGARCAAHPGVALLGCLMRREVRTNFLSLFSVALVLASLRGVGVLCRIVFGEDLKPSLSAVLGVTAALCNLQCLCVLCCLLVEGDP